MDNETIQVIGMLLSPLYVISGIFIVQLFSTKKCVTQMKTALQMKFPDLKDILK